ncbi:hypothetical protein OHB56_01935 [Streptomyces sp. NBC_01635]|uniref:8-oxoguanine DNA glycosylase OGG fold protein n=1 Tax=Streptomyces sp. NBC_01635 TaxID=2975904 RepID=UPI003866C6CF|nr:hypothetical protein OHB56_01935 [Streptomyces sp. NBC_01635]
MSRQDRADAVDRVMAERLLPEAAVQALGRWWRENEVTYADGTPGAHAVRYTPARWAEIVPWPSGLAPASDDGDTWVSRAQVARIVADALKREDFREALVAAYVWGKGKRGTPAGSGPTTLHKNLDGALADAVTALTEKDAQKAYSTLHQKVTGLGPSFFTKFLYFAGHARPSLPGGQPLILDRVLSLRMRSLAVAVGQDTGLDPDGSIAAWVWADWNWSPHRYSVYLAFIHKAARQLADTDTWPSHATPDLLECALFNATWSITG